MHTKWNPKVLSNPQRVPFPTMTNSLHQTNKVLVLSVYLPLRYDGECVDGCVIRQHVDQFCSFRHSTLLIIDTLASHQIQTVFQQSTGERNTVEFILRC